MFEESQFMLSSGKFFLVFLRSSFVMAKESPLFATKIFFQAPEHRWSWEIVLETRVIGGWG